VVIFLLWGLIVVLGRRLAVVVECGRQSTHGANSQQKVGEKVEEFV
jgi:hypothetical protein